MLNKENKNVKAYTTLLFHSFKVLKTIDYNVSYLAYEICKQSSYVSVYSVKNQIVYLNLSIIFHQKIHTNDFKYKLSPMRVPIHAHTELQAYTDI